MKKSLLSLTFALLCFGVMYAQKGESCDNPIEFSVPGSVSLPLTLGDDALLKPIYVALTADKDGWLYLNFTPSVSGVEYSTDCAEPFKYLKNEYIMSNGVTTGSKTRLEVRKDQRYIFKVIGFNTSVVTSEIIEAVPGTMCDFPIDIQSGDNIIIPAAAGDYYYRITPEKEGQIEITSTTPGSIPGGYVEVMMDCNNFNAFVIDDDLWLRNFVWDRMEYLIHINKAVATASDETVNVTVNPSLECDEFDPGQTISLGETVSTPRFAGKYYYRVTSPATGGTLTLNIPELPADPDTRVNLHSLDDSYLSIARGFDMKYETEPSTSYILEWTVLDNRRSIPFSVSIGGASAIEDLNGDDGVSVSVENGAIVVSGNEVAVDVFNLWGQHVATRRVSGVERVPLTPGAYIVKTGPKVTKAIVR